ncbi:MAG TPA: hypothetical protein VEG67_06105 [Myxococcota bacterium]|nr:hypothetical protein [Myxococcota bacterium]
MRNSSSIRSFAAALGLASCLMFAGAPARASGAGTNAGLQVGAFFTTLLYGPVKVCYAVVGSVVSGLAWGVTAGSSEVAWPIFVSAAYGDYVVTPDHLTGQRPLEFVGRDTPAASTTAVSDEAKPTEDSGTP